MRGQCITLKPNGDVTTMELSEPPPLDLLQQGVGGYIEKVPMFDRFDNKRCIVFCNEEGKLHNLPYNREASRRWHALNNHRISDVLVGNVVILTGDAEFMEAL